MEEISESCTASGSAEEEEEEELSSAVDANLELPAEDSLLSDSEG